MTRPAVSPGGEMKRTQFPRTFLVSLLIFTLGVLTSGAAAQEKNEISGLLGRTFISDQGVKGLPPSDSILHFGDRITWEVNYGRHLADFGILGLTVEVPFVVNFNQDMKIPVNLVPKNYQSYFLTPALRANLFPGTGFSPWVSLGGGFGRFNENSTLEFGGPNPGPSGTTTGVLQAGIGLDVHILRSLGVRGEVRDFYSGVPQLNVDTGKSRQHNYFVGAGVIWRF